MPTITITVDATVAARIATAVGNRLSLLDGSGVPRPATSAEVKQFLVAWLKGQVRDAETSIERDRIVVTDIEAT